MRQARKRQAAGAVRPDKISQLIDLLARQMVGRALRVDSAHTAARVKRAAEHLERTVGKQVGQIGQLHAEAHVGLVGAKAAHRLVIRHTQKRRLDLNAEHLMKHALHKAFVDRHHVVLVDKRHLQVDLCEFRLTVSAQVLVAEAPSDLHIPVKSGQHQHLLILLRRLRQRVKRSGMHAAGHQIITRAFRRRFDQRGRFDLNKAVLIIIIVRCLHNLMAHKQSMLHLAAAQVKITVTQAQLLLDVRLIRNLKRGRLRPGQDAQVVDIKLDLAGRDIAVDRFAPAHSPLRHQYEFSAHCLRLGAQIGGGFIIKGELHDARAVAQIDKYQHPLVAHALDPSAYDRLPAVVGSRKRAAIVCPF